VPDAFFDAEVETGGCDDVVGIVQPLGGLAKMNIVAIRVALRPAKERLRGGSTKQGSYEGERQGGKVKERRVDTMSLKGLLIWQDTYQSAGGERSQHLPDSASGGGHQSSATPLSC
jgi:hypothetical protein